MAYNRLNTEQKTAVAALPEPLATLANDIFVDAQTQGCFHDTACDMLERGELKDYTNAQISEVLTTMGSYWDYTDDWGVKPS